MQNPTAHHFHDDQDIEHSKASRNRYQKVAGYNRLGVISDKGPPVLRTGSVPSPRITLARPVGAHGPRRHLNPQLQGKLRGYPLLSPGRVLFRHPHDQLAHVLRQPWSSHLRLPPPKQMETFAVPADESPA